MEGRYTPPSKLGCRLILAIPIFEKIPNPFDTFPKIFQVSPPLQCPILSSPRTKLGEKWLKTCLKQCCLFKREDPILQRRRTSMVVWFDLRSPSYREGLLTFVWTVDPILQRRPTSRNCCYAGRQWGQRRIGGAKHRMVVFFFSFFLICLAGCASKDNRILCSSCFKSADPILQRRPIWKIACKYPKYIRQRKHALL